MQAATQMPQNDIRVGRATVLPPSCLQVHSSTGRPSKLSILYTLYWAPPGPQM